MPFRFDDEPSVHALQILADAVEGSYVHGVVELRTLRNAIDDALKEQTPGALRAAQVAFSKVDREFQRRIVEKARAIALQNAAHHPADAA